MRKEMNQTGYEVSVKRIVKRFTPEAEQQRQELTRKQKREKKSIVSLIA